MIKSSVVSWCTVFQDFHWHWFNKCQKANGIPKLWNACTSWGSILPHVVSGAGCVLQRVMASFITRQQHNNIPHVDRTLYSPQRSGGSAQKFCLEQSSRSSSLHAPMFNCSQMGLHAYGFCPFLNASSQSDRKWFCVAVITLAVKFYDRRKNK